MLAWIMVQIIQEIIQEKITFDEFIQWIPEGNRYELHHGAIVEMNPPVGEHENISMFLTGELTGEFKRLNLLSKFAIARISEYLNP